MATVASVDKCIIGKRRVQYTSKRTGAEVTGTEIFYATSIGAEVGKGFRCDSSFVSGHVFNFDNITLFKPCEVLYDRFGRVSGIRYTEES